MAAVGEGYVSSVVQLGQSSQAASHLFLHAEAESRCGKQSADVRFGSETASPKLKFI